MVEDKLPRDSAGLKVYPSKGAGAICGLYSLEHARNALVHVDQTLPSRHVRPNISGVKEKDGDRASEVAKEALGDDVERTFARPVGVCAAAHVVVDAPNLPKITASSAAAMK